MPWLERTGSAPVTEDGRQQPVVHAAVNKLKVRTAG
jgi:hypothetical protein